MGIVLSPVVQSALLSLWKEGTPLQMHFLYEAEFSPYYKTEEGKVGSLLVSAQSCPHAIGAFGEGHI